MAAPGQNEATPDREAALALVTIASSAGSLKPLLRIASDLPHNFPAAIVVAQHLSAHSILPEILGHVAEVPVRSAEPDMLLEPGAMYVCPPLRHIAIAPDARISLSPRDRVDHVRPSGDWLFESAAATFRERLIGVVLSGTLRDGSRGVARIRAAGGRVLVQTPESSVHADVPRAALATGCVDFAVPPRLIVPMLCRLLRRMDLAGERARWENPFAQECLAV